MSWGVSRKSRRVELSSTSRPLEASPDLLSLFEFAERAKQGTTGRDSTLFSAEKRLAELRLLLLHRLRAFCASQGRSRFEFLGQFRAGGGRVVFDFDNVALQAGQCAQQIILLSFSNVEFIEGF